jgi:hypothetical protein
LIKLCHFIVDSKRIQYLIILLQAAKYNQWARGPTF